MGIAPLSTLLLFAIYYCFLTYNNINKNIDSSQSDDSVKSFKDESIKKGEKENIEANINELPPRKILNNDTSINTKNKADPRGGKLNSDKVGEVAPSPTVSTEELFSETTPLPLTVIVKKPFEIYLKNGIWGVPSGSSIQILRRIGDKVVIKYKDRELEITQAQILGSKVKKENISSKTASPAPEPPGGPVR